MKRVCTASSMWALTPTRRAGRRCLGLLAGLALSAVLLPGQSPPSVRGEVTTEAITIGDVIGLTIQAESSPMVSFQPLEFKDPGPFEVRSVGKPTRTKQGDAVVWRWEIELTVFETGTQTIPALQLHYRPQPEAEISTVETGPWEVEVSSVLAESAEDILDIKQPLPIRRSLWSYWPWGLLALPLMALAWWWSRTRGRPGETAPPPPLLPPHEEALQALRDLERRGHLESGRHKAFYTSLSDIVRRYLWRRFDIVAMEATTSDISRQLRSGVVQDPVIAAVDALLERCDMVKFARVKPSGEEGSSSLLEARRLVETTLPTPEPDPPLATSPGGATP